MQLSVRINDISKFFLIEFLEVQWDLGNFVFILIKLISNFIKKINKKMDLKIHSSLSTWKCKLSFFFFSALFFSHPLHSIWLSKRQFGQPDLFQLIKAAVSSLAIIM